MTIFKELEQIALKFIWKQKRPQITKELLQRKNKAGGMTMQDFELYYKAVITKRAWYWHNNRHIEQWNRIGNPEMDPQLFGQLIFENTGKKSGKKTVFSINGAGKIGQLRAKQ